MFPCEGKFCRIILIISFMVYMSLNVNIGINATAIYLHLSMTKLILYTVKVESLSQILTRLPKTIGRIRIP